MFVNGFWNPRPGWVRRPASAQRTGKPSCLRRAATSLSLGAKVGGTPPDRAPKNKASLGRYQFVLIKDASLVDWLCWVLEGISPMARLWPSSQSSFSKFFRRCLERLGLTRLRLSPGSLRPGGATAHFLHFSSISILRILGRWRVESSLDHYIQTVVSHLCHADLNDKEFETISILIDRTVAQ